MNSKITITAGSVSIEGELNDTPCARAILDALPIEATARTWGDEIYFDIGVSCDLAADAREDVAVGELAYWPAGTAFCIFLGRTPTSGPDGRPRAASSVNPIGKLLGDPQALKQVHAGNKVALSKTG